MSLKHDLSTLRQAADADRAFQKIVQAVTRGILKRWNFTLDSNRRGEVMWAHVADPDLGIPEQGVLFRLDQAGEPQIFMAAGVFDDVESGYYGKTYTTPLNDSVRVERDLRELLSYSID